MATGDQKDAYARLNAVLPKWFGDSQPVVTAILQAYAWAVSFIYSLWAYAALQTRVKTATDGWLDMISADFFGASLLRKANQTDASYRGRILSNLFRERATRRAVTSVLTDLTGRAPRIFEPSRPLDTGSYGAGCGYGLAGGYGSLLLPVTAFVTAYRPLTSGIPFIAGYGSPSSGYSVPSYGEYASMSMIIDYVTDADIFAAVDSVKPGGSSMWVAITN